MSAEEMKQQRTQAAHRQRRIIFNSDGCDRIFAKAATPEGLLEVYTEPLLGSHVDSIFYCDIYGFNLLAHNSDVSEVCLVDNVTRELIKQGTDALEITVDYCRKHDIEIFWSLRINDEHDSWGADPMPQFKEDHTDYLLGTKEDPPPHGAWSAVDYAVPEVREQAFRIIEDVCQRYDIDGIEVDFFRQLTCFKSVAWGQPVSQEERDMMTKLLRRVRTMTEEVTRERGRPLLIAVRVPDCPEYSRALGLDWEQWLEEDLIDILVVGGYFQLRPWQDAVELGHKYDVPVYPCLSESRMELPHRGPARQARNSPEGYRARAMNVWNSGADGVYLFNFNYRFAPDHPIWRQLGDLQTLQPFAKLYHASVMGLGHPTVNHYLPGGHRYVRVPLLSPDHIAAGATQDEPLRVELEVGEDVMWGTDKSLVPRITLRLQVLNLYKEKLTSPYNVEVKLNGRLLDAGRISEEWLEYSPDPHIVKQGTNEIEIAPSRVYHTSCNVHDVELQVKYEKAI